MSDNSFYVVDGPLDALPGARQMRTANFTGFEPLVRHLGGDPRSVLERHGMDARAIRDPDSYMDCQSLVDILEYCSAAFNDPLFGLRLAEQQNAEVFGCVTALCRAASTFREAIQSFITYIPVVHSPISQMELVEGRDIAEFRWLAAADLGTNRQAHYQAALLDLKVFRLLGGRDFRASYVNLAIESRPKDIAELERALGCRFHGGAPTNAIAFPCHFLNQPVLGANKLVYRLLGGYLDRVKDASRTTVEQRVSDYIRGALPSGTCSIEHCAQKLVTSVRTLQMQLSESRLQFSEIVEQQRIGLAKDYLGQSRMSLDEVAALLGYSEQSSFGRAFKRWTGTTPKQFRESKEYAPEMAH
jgi:AraC-like DNA-binding protein